MSIALTEFDAVYPPKVALRQGVGIREQGSGYRGSSEKGQLHSKITPISDLTSPLSSLFHADPSARITDRPDNLSRESLHEAAAPTPGPWSLWLGSAPASKPFTMASITQG